MKSIFFTLVAIPNIAVALPMPSLPPLEQATASATTPTPSPSVQISMTPLPTLPPILIAPVVEAPSKPAPAAPFADIIIFPDSEPVEPSANPTPPTTSPAVTVLVARTTRQLVPPNPVTYALTATFYEHTALSEDITLGIYTLALVFFLTGLWLLKEKAFWQLVTNFFGRTHQILRRSYS